MILAVGPSASQVFTQSEVDKFEADAAIALQDTDASARARDLVSVVFIPGIPGSELRDSSGRTLWGSGIASAERLRLLDSGDPQVEAEVLREYNVGPIHDDTYKTILRDLESAAGNYAGIEPFGYDWRLDFDTLASKLDAFLRHESRRHRRFVIIAHSMGTVVTWRWQEKFADKPDRPDISELVLLGGPLSGSCEMARTLVEGWRNPPSEPEDWLGHALRDIVVGDLRPAAFTFPSVFQILPPSPSAGAQRAQRLAQSCVVLAEEGKERQPVDFRDIRFWKSDFGLALLQEAWKPLRLSRDEFFHRLEIVLRQALNFRLSLDKSRIPTTYYYAQHIDTTRQLILHIRASRKTIRPADVTPEPLRAPGDGRVLSDVATNITDRSESRRELIEDFTHGRLPASPDFRKQAQALVSNAVRVAVANHYARELRRNAPALERFRSSPSAQRLDELVQELGKDRAPEVAMLAAELAQRATPPAPAPSTPSQGPPSAAPIPSGAEVEAAIDRILEQMDLRALLGQVLVVGFADKKPQAANERLAALIRNHGIGSVVLYAFNFPDQATAAPGDTASYVARLTADLRRAAYDSQPPGRKIPLFIAVDQEGGSDVRISRDVTRMPHQIHIGATRNPALSEQVGAAIGSELAALGINVDFSPVADINTQHQTDLIGRRAFSSRADVAAALSVAWARGLQQAGVLAVAKHYPGHGNAKTDPHRALANMGYQTRTELEENDAIPFKAVAQSGVDGIMTSHMLTPLDGDSPVTISPPAIRYLRNDLRFEGLVVTDDIVDMMGILMNEQGRIIRNQATVARQALRAGHDLILFGNLSHSELTQDPERTMTVKEFAALHATLFRHFEANPEDRDLLRASVRRILRAKAKVAPLDGTLDEWVPPFDPRAFEALVTKNGRLAREVAEASAILITERGRVIEHIADAAHFRDGVGPLKKGQLWAEEDRVLLVSPVTSPPDPLYEALQAQWIPPDRIDHHPLIYGWTDADSRERLSRLWKRPVPEYSHVSSITGETEYFPTAIDPEVQSIVAEAQRARVVVFGALKHEHLRILRRVCEKLKDPAREIIILLSKEPYFLSSDFYRQRNVTVLHLSPWPSTAIAADFLFGHRLPLAATALPVAVPGIVERPRGLDHK